VWHNLDERCSNKVQKNQPKVEHLGVFKKIKLKHLAILQKLGEGRTQAEISIMSSFSKASVNYWVKKFSGDLEKSGFPYDFKPGDLKERKINVLDFRFPDTVNSKLLEFYGESDLKLYKVLVSGLVGLLSRYKYIGRICILNQELTALDIKIV